MPTPTDHATRSRLALLDILRLLAALSVVAYHWLFWGPENGAVHAFTSTPVTWLAAYGFLGVQRREPAFKQRGRRAERAPSRSS